jgi:hypothetical protein
VGEGAPLKEGEPLGEGDPEALRLGPREALPVAQRVARAVKEGALVLDATALTVGARCVAVAGALREALPPLGLAQRGGGGLGDAVRVPASALAEALPRGERDMDAEADGERLSREEAHAEALPEALPVGEGVGGSVGEAEGVGAGEREREGASRTLAVSLRAVPPARATARNNGSGTPAGSGSAPSGKKKPPSIATAAQGASPSPGATVKSAASAPGPHAPLPSRSVNVARAGPSMEPRGAPAGAATRSSCSSVRPPEGSLRPT